MRFDKGPVTFALVGAGGRAGCYIRAIEKYYPNDFKVVAIADPDKEKQNYYSKKYNIKKENIFDGYEEFIKKDRMCDVVIVATLDDMHYIPAISLIEKGYDMILEKPIGFSLQETIEIGECARKHKNQFIAVCHVLRHTPFFSKIKEIIDSKELGEVIDIQHNENVGYFHYAHSYVRGNWRNTKISAPFIVAKSCHDMDILLYLLGNKRCLNLSSMGSLSFFNHQHFDEKRMAKRCTDCSIEKKCPYSALKIYTSGLIKSIVFDLTTPEKILKTFSTSQYGRCVFACDNNVCDNQVTILEFEGGVHATFNASAFTNKNQRTIKIMCEYGEIRGLGHKKLIEVQKFGEEKPTIIELGDSSGGHGGGDEGFCVNFMESYLHGKEFASPIDMSIESHVMAFAADISKKNNGKVINIPEFWENEIKKL